MKKALVVASVAGFFTFEKNDIKILKELGYEVECAANFEKDKGELDDLQIKKNNIPFRRNPFNRTNVKAYKELKKLIDIGDFNIVHCHTPIGGVLTRLACRKQQKKGNIYVIYTAHGFHFFDGAPLKNWLLFYPVEKFLAKYTDVLITINLEDYERACKNFKVKKIEHVTGVGINIDNFNLKNFNYEVYRSSLRLKKEDFMLFSIGELNENKNHEIVIKALSKIKNKKIHYFIAGVGNKDKYLMDLASEIGIDKQIHLLGHRKDIAELLHCTNLYIHPSFREGLPVSLMEAISSCIPSIGSNIRGVRDLILNPDLLFNPKDCDKLARVIENKLASLVFSKIDYIDINKIDMSTISKKMKIIYEKNEL